MLSKEIAIWMTPRQASDINSWKQAFAHSLRVSPYRVRHIIPLQKSIDARGGKVKIRLKADVYLDEMPSKESLDTSVHFPDVSRKKPVIVIGAGPAGLFAALTLILQGVKPVIIERGKEIKARKFDIATLSRDGIVNPDSNYCFGEGGAGTYSDGKIYTRSTKRGNVRDILNLLVQHGADSSILYESHPHIGTDKLPAIISAIRRSILEAGGEVHFNERVNDFIITKGKFKGVVTEKGNSYEASACILATGHSARDIYELLDKKGIALEAKSFALGVRVEHPQQLINEIQYKGSASDPFLPSAAYSLVQQVENRGVFSFCMCPGGIIVPAATASGEIVVNGMSNSKRNSPFANSGIVVTVEPSDFRGYGSSESMSGLAFQSEIEARCWEISSHSQKAPALRLTDFLDGKISSSLPETSYHPGHTIAKFDDIFPEFVSIRLKKGFKQFNNLMKGYISREAVVVATESRTSSPVRIPRNPETFQHPQVSGLYPCGEGSGYSGGIISSAIDGVNCAVAASTVVKGKSNN